VDRAVRGWALRAAERHPEAVRIGYFGSYARGDWGVGSDVDLVVIVERSERPFESRALDWDATDLPVPAEAVVYTVDEWEALPREGRFRRTLEREAVWVMERR
jgi:predicted nucleotidyltransferase